MKNMLFRLAAVVARTYLQKCPVAAGKQQIWDRVLRPYIAFRDLTFEAQTRTGVRLVLNTSDTIQRHIYYFGLWEPVITAYMRQQLRPGDTFVDVGANIGYHSLLASQLVGATGSVYSIEASPSIFAGLRRNIAKNDARNITPIHAAVYCETAELPIYLHAKDNLGASTIISDVANRRVASVEAIVRAAKLQDLLPLETISRARLIKIDVEGAEWPVLRGMAAILPALSARTEIVVEIEPESLREQSTSVEEFISVFERGGFQPYTLNGSLVDDYCATYRRVQPPVTPERMRKFELQGDRTEVLFRRGGGAGQGALS